MVATVVIDCLEVHCPCYMSLPKPTQYSHAPSLICITPHRARACIKCVAQ